MKRFDEFKSESEFIFDLGDGLVKRVPVQVHGNSDGSIDIILPPEIEEAQLNGEITPKPDCSVVWEPDPDTGFYSLAVSADEIFSLSPALERRWRAEALAARRH